MNKIGHVFTSKPVIIEAVQYNGADITPLRNLLKQYGKEDEIILGGSDSLFYLRLPGRTDGLIEPGYWISVETVKNQVTLFSPQAFELMFGNE